MKRVIIFFVAALVASLIPQTVKAQVSAFDEGSNRIGIGAGFKSLPNENIVIPPLTISYERGALSLGNFVIGFGGVVEYASYASSEEGQTNASDISVLAMAKIHFPIGERVEVNPYVGFGYGFLPFYNNWAFSAGVEGLFQISNSLSIFASLHTKSFIGLSVLNAGLYIQF